MGLGGQVATIGTGTIKFGDNFHRSLPDMVVEAATLAMADAKIESKQLQADTLNLTLIPVTRVAAYLGGPGAVAARIVPALI